VRPAAFLVFNIVGLLLIGGLLEAPRLAAATLILIGFALPAGLAYEVRRARLDRDLAVAAAWWSAPFIVLLLCYLVDGGLVLTLGSGLVCAGLGHVARMSIARHAGVAAAESGLNE
jgi:heme A synthase